ncbi:MAG: glycosyltransferase [Roseiflexaceae bacterium]|nr:glycosyltransferase [Roseiflexaceae bacterium]
MSFLGSSTVVIIPVHNGERYVRACLQAIQQQQGFTPTVITVENGSSDASANLIASEFPLVRLLKAAKPLGFAGAINMGLLAAQSLPHPPAMVALLNQDTEVDPGWLAALHQCMADEPQLGIVGSLARFPDGSIQHAGADLIEPLWYGHNRQSRNQISTGTPFLSFLGVALRSSMIASIGLLDDGFGAGYYEDADYCLRAVAANWGLVLADDATLLHHEGAISQTSYRHAALLERNRLRLLLKHRAPADLLGPTLVAEQAQLLGRANQGSSQVLRQAYLQALIEWPTIAATRGLPDEQYTSIADMLKSLRDLAIARERRSRMYGLPNQQSALTPSPSPSGTGAEGEGESRDVPLERLESEERTGFTRDQSLRSPMWEKGLGGEGNLPPVSIIMLTWNGLAVTQACIASIRAHTLATLYQLIVVDNGSTDGTREWLRDQPDITLIANTTNLGFTRGNNQGMAAAPTDHDILLLNNDTLMTQDGWLNRLRAVAHSEPTNGIVGCTLLHTNGRLQHAGTVMPDNLWGYQIGGGELYVGQYPGVRQVEGITGACMYIRRDLYDTIGGLDDAFFSYYEDSDYCLRAIQSGFRVVCTGDVQIIHHENTSTKVNRSDWQAMFSAGRQIFERKWRDHYDKRYDRGLLWHSLFAAQTGYATSSREFVRELDQHGIDVRTACVFGTDYTEPKTHDPRIDQLLSRPKDLSLPQVVYSQADAFVKNSGRYKIGFTMHETDRLPIDWVQQCNQMDEVWTPTHWGADAFRASGVTRPLHVIPLGFNPDYFHPGIQGRKPHNRFVFLSVFDWIERKGPDILVQAYLQTFRPDDDVVLLLKVMNSDPYFDLQRHVAELIGSGPHPAIVLVHNQKIAAAQLGSLYKSADCFVLPTRGEGWGMPTLEAMACGLPVISTGWGAQSEFLHEQIGFPLRIRGFRPAVTRSPYYAGTNWAEPDRDHLCTLMRYVYENPAQAQAIGAHAATDVHQRWTWSKAAERIIARLEALGE